MQASVYSRASLSKKTRFWVFENIVMRKKLGPQRREVTGTEETRASEKGSNRD